MVECIKKTTWQLKETGFTSCRLLLTCGDHNFLDFPFPLCLSSGMTYQCPQLKAVERIGKNFELLKLSALWIKPRRKNVYPTTSKESMAQRHSHQSWLVMGQPSTLAVWCISRNSHITKLGVAPHHLAGFEGWPSFKGQVESKHQK